jgi:predicted O-linked N-acetylglucosamine transferase (SPINDLY family)
MTVTAQEILNSATDHHKAGQLAQARTLYLQTLDHEPRNSDALHRMGVLSLQTGNAREALDFLQRAVAIQPADALYHFSLGQTLSILNRHDQAIAAFTQALQLRPQFPDAWSALGTALHGKMRLNEAIGAYRQALAQQPGHFDAAQNLGNALCAIGRLDEAIVMLRQSAARRPDFAVTHNNLAVALQKKGQLPEAAAALRKALDLKPDFAEAHCNLGNCLRDLGELAQALPCYRKAIELRPNYVEALNNLGNLYQATGDFQAAVDSYHQALKHRPDYLEAQNNLGAALRTMGRTDEAVAAYRSALALRPDFAPSHCNLGNALKDRGEIAPAIDCYRRAIAHCPNDAISHSNLAYALHFIEFDGGRILAENLRWNQQHALPLIKEQLPHHQDAANSGQRRLRIGYISPDFKEHCQTLFTVPVLSNHDHEAFEIFCYANVVRPDQYTQRLQGYADVWRSTLRMSDAKVAQMIRDDRIDILVDLTMHMSNGRPLVMARKPAPVQVAWLAYPGTTGLSAMDYRLTDPWLDPPGTDADYSEKSMRLPDSFWCYDPLTDQPPVNDLPAMAAGHILFGCLNNLCKVSDYTLDLWSRVMEIVAGSRLVLLSSPGEHRRALLGRFSARNIDAGRIEFVPFQPRQDYLREYHRIDLGLDTLPYNGHTTSLDSFWMGVPVVTRLGRTAVGRAGWGQLNNLGLPELAADTDDAFVKIASELAMDLPRLRNLRRDLRERMHRSALMNGQRFTRNMEQTYLRLWSNRLENAQKTS